MPEVTDIGICGNQANAILWPGFRQIPASPQGSLYRPWKKPEKKAVTLTFIPYYMWANRSDENGSEMQVWTRY
ncbi:MAG: hypothetical protein LIO76_09855 [Clostridiales bacterium]|nr:hypothetical protein [Clostridiales bacterium]